MRMLAALVSLAFTSTALAAEPMATPGQALTVAPPAPAPAAAEPVYGKAEGLIPGMVIGPKFALLPVPYAFGLGLEAKFANQFGAGLDYNWIPSLGIGDEVKVGFSDISLNGRVFPWKGRFYVGAALGQRNFFAKVQDSLSREQLKVEVKSTYLAPEVGWRFVWGGGFFMGIDLGYQIVVSSKMSLTLPTGLGVDPTDKKNVEDAGSDLGKVGLPIISLIQLGFYL